MNRFGAVFASVVALTGASPSSAQPIAPDVCAILASRLQPDVLLQGTMSQQFSQLQQLVSDQKYQDYSSASSSNNAFSLGFSIPDEVDLAIGDNQHSNSSNWGTRRAQFLSMNFQQTSSTFKSSNYLSQTSIAVVHEISECAQAIANSRANGVFVVLDQVSPNRDSFAVKLTYRTDGNPSNWALTEFHVEPADPKFKCDGFELASETHKIKLQALTREIGCSKNPGAHLTLVVNTTQGGGVSIPLDSIDEEIRKLREDMDAKIAGLSARLDKAATDTTATISGVSARIDTLRQGLVAKSGDESDGPSININGGYGPIESRCPDGYYAVGVRNKGNRGGTCTGCFNEVQVLCKKLNVP